MDELLARLCEVPGVLGAAIFQNQKCLAHRLTPPHEPVLLEEALSQLSRMGDALESLEGMSGNRTLFLRFQEGQLIVSHVNEACLVVLASNKTQAAVLSVGLNVAQLKLERMLIQAPSGAPLSMSAVPVGASPTPPPLVANYVMPQAVTPGFPRSDPPPIPALASPSVDSSLNAFNSSNSVVGGDSVGMTTIRHLIRVFSEFEEQDPQGKVRQAIAKLGGSPTHFPKSHYPVLVQELSSQLPARLRKDFQARLSE